MGENTVPVRVNVPNPDPNSNQQRVVAVVNPDGNTAHTAAGQTVQVTNQDGTVRPEVIVHGK